MLKIYRHTALSAASGFSNSISAWSFEAKLTRTKKKKKKQNENFFLMEQSKLLMT